MHIRKTNRRGFPSYEVVQRHVDGNKRVHAHVVPLHGHATIEAALAADRELRAKLVAAVHALSSPPGDLSLAMLRAPIQNRLGELDVRIAELGHLLADQKR